MTKSYFSIIDSGLLLEAFKISYNGLFRMQMSGIGIPMNMVVTEWFVPGFGIVKTESYNKNGKLMGSSMLTSIKK